MLHGYPASPKTLDLDNRTQSLLAFLSGYIPTPDTLQQYGRRHFPHMAHPHNALEIHDHGTPVSCYPTRKYTTRGGLDYYRRCPEAEI